MVRSLKLYRWLKSQELEFFAKQLDKLDTALELDTELLPILGKLNWRGI